jgi:hypothetical protein
MEHRIPVPNPLVNDWLKGDECRDLVKAVIAEAEDLFRAVAAFHARTGREARSARTSVAIGGVIKGPNRWLGTLTVGGPTSDAPYSTPDQFGAFRTGKHHQAPAHDLNTTLNLLAQLG